MAKGMYDIDNGVLCRILGAAAKLCAMLIIIVYDEKRAPKAAERDLMEVFDITTCLAQPQEYLVVPRAGSECRKHLS